METLIKDILKSPKLGLYYKEIENILLDEKKKREEFYRSMKEDDKVEFINGEIVFSSPVKLRHNQCSSLLLNLIDNYVRINNLGIVGHEKLLISMSRNDYEPDICFFYKSKSENFHAKQMQFPAPDFVAEILSPSTEFNDRVIKFEDYAAHGVKEYWIIDPETNVVEQYELINEKYELGLKSNNGIIKSFVVNNFEIPIQSIFNNEENLKALKNIIKLNQ